MRTSTLIIIAALTMFPSAARAQQESPAGPAPGVGTWLDVGIRGTDFTGDGARYERYRDLGNGLFLDALQVNRHRNGWLFDLAGQHVGRRDQRLSGNIEQPGKLKIQAQWDQIPMLMSRTTKTLFADGSPGILTIDPVLRTAVQANVNALPSIFANSARVFDTESRRHIGEGGFEYVASADITVRGNVRYTDREGVIPYGGSFGHSSLVETPAPVNHTLADVESSAEVSHGRLLLRTGYTGSWFHNEVTSLTFDSPFRATDLTTTPSRGRLSLPPSNSFLGVNGLASLRLPGRSRATAYLSLGSLKDAGAPIMPQTVNAANAGAIVALPRSTVEGQARTTAANLTFTSRPNRYVDVSVGYRSYNYNNRTPEFLSTQRVSYDNAPVAETLGTEPFGLVRNTFDADLRVTPVAAATGGIGFTRLEEERTHRIFESTTDNVLRLTFDSTSHTKVSLRTKYEHAQRRGKGDPAEIAAELLAIGEQPGMRHFDIAPRDRDRVTAIGSLMLTGNVAVNGSVAAGKDNYLQSLFGLRDNTHRIYAAGVDATPLETVTLALSYSHERYRALSRSRQATPGVQFDDPSRDWATDSADRVHSVVLTGEIAKIGNKADLTVGYDFNTSRSRYDYLTGPVASRTLPEEASIPSTLPPPKELPTVRSQLSRGSADLVYWLASHVGVGVSYWYEAYRVKDFTLDADANLDLAKGQVLLVGYMYRPYTANTLWGRIFYRW